MGCFMGLNGIFMGISWDMKFEGIVFPLIMIISPLYLVYIRNIHGFLCGDILGCTLWQHGASENPV